jgi:hypothetical protein
MTKCINIKVSKFWISRDKRGKLLLSRWKNKKAVLNIKLIDPKYGEIFGYQPDDCLAVIFSPDDGMVATVNIYDDSHWIIAFKNPEYYDNTGIPTNAAIFKLTGVDERTKFLWFKFFSQERLLRYGGFFNKLSFSKKHTKPAAMSIHNV